MFVAMLDWTQCPAVERVPGKVSGAWVFKTTRVAVRALFENLEDGATVNDFLAWFPGVTRAQVAQLAPFVLGALVFWTIKDRRNVWMAATLALGVTTRTADAEALDDQQHPERSVRSPLCAIAPVRHAVMVSRTRSGPSRRSRSRPRASGSRTAGPTSSARSCR